MPRWKLSTSWMTPDVVAQIFMLGMATMSRRMEAPHRWVQVLGKPSVEHSNVEGGSTASQRSLARRVRMCWV